MSLPKPCCSLAIRRRPPLTIIGRTIRQAATRRISTSLDSECPAPPSFSVPLCVLRGWHVRGRRWRRSGGQILYVAAPLVRPRPPAPGRRLSAASGERSLRLDGGCAPPLPASGEHRGSTRADAESTRTPSQDIAPGPWPGR
jgi:hypothetical protein